MTDAREYVLGDVHPNTKSHATLETKPPSVGRDGRRDTGAGYERWRSTEHRPHTTRDGKEDVYVPVHRLLAVVACYDMDTPLSNILDDLDGRDVHHTTGVEWCNFEGGDGSNFEQALQVRGHGEHSGVTNAQRRAWAETAKKQMEQDSITPDTERCDGCGDESDVLTRSPDWEGLRCVPCSQRESDGATIEVVD